MSKRREFTRDVKKEIVRRATIKGTVFCEECGLLAKSFQIDHTIPDAMQIDKSKPLAATDGRLLCSGTPESCHDVKTTQRDVPAIAKAKRIEATHLGIDDGGPTGLEGRSPQQKRAAKERRTSEGGKLALPPRRSMFADLPTSPPEARRLTAPERER